MPNIKAAEKWSRQTQKRTKRNLDTKSRLKTLFRKAATLADPSAASTVEAQFDKAAAKGIIHPNKAARKKSRLAKTIKNASGTSKISKPSRSKKTSRKKPTAKKASKKAAG